MGTKDGAAGALAGVRVLELTAGLPGAYCGRLLAELGADVVKLESRRRPDVTRTSGPFPGDAPDPERSGSHRYLHARKRSVALDVATPTGAQLLDRLAAGADVLVDDGALGAPADALARYRALLDAHPQLVVHAFSPYGLEGPKAGWASTELTELAAGGWLQASAPGLPPLMTGTPMAHHAAGAMGAAAVLLALAARRRTGRGQLAETRSNEAFLSMLTCPTTLYAMTGVDGYRAGDSYPYAIHRCADGWLGVSILTQAQWTGLCELMGRPDLTDHPRYGSGVARARPDVAAELHRIIAAWIADRPALETFERGQAMRVPIAIVPSPSEVLASPHYAARGWWTDVEDPALGPLRLPGPPFRTDDDGSWFAPHRDAPVTGADTAAVLGGEAATLARAGVAW